MPSMKHTALNRRLFLQSAARVGAFAGATALLAACTQPKLVQPSATEDAPGTTPTALGTVKLGALPTPTATEETNRALVAIVRTDNRAQGVRAAIQLLPAIAAQARNVLVKPNCNSADPAPGSTHPDVLRTLVEELWSAQAASIAVADRSGMGDTRGVMTALGLDALARELDFDLIVLDELDRDGWELINRPDSHWSQGFPFARPALDADLVVQACCLKTHRFGGHFTLSLKNSVGLAGKYLPGDGYNYMQELHGSEHQRRMIAEINAAYQPALIVMDGVEAFVRGGPDRGDLVAANVVLAGTDRVAVDAVGVALLRLHGTTPEVSAGPIFGQEQIARAVELGLGVAEPAQIALVTGDEESAALAIELRSLLEAG